MEADAKKIIPDISADAWQKYLNTEGSFGNKRALPDNVSFWDAVLSVDTDSVRTPDGERLIDIIRDL